jgi:cation transport regulator
MPYSTIADLPASIKDNLPTVAQKLWLGAFNGAFAGTCNKDDICARKIAWYAVKRKYKKGADGKWVAKFEGLIEDAFELVITKASYDKKDGVMRFACTASDIQKDSRDERMSLPLFNDFITRAVAKEKPPVQFCSDYWSGGMPYASISHYSDLNGKGAAGILDSLYIDGQQLKGKGHLYDTPLGRAVWKSICESLYSGNVSEDRKVRISIAFIDWKHAHNDMVFERKSLSDSCPMCYNSIDNKVYLKGHLIHFAFTRVPVNKRTEITTDVEVLRSMTTQKEDAASIVGEELASELDEESKAIVQEALVVKAEETELICPHCGATAAEKVDKCPECEGDFTTPAWSIYVTEDSEATPEVVEEAGVTKKEADGEHPSSHYLVVEDAKKPTTWHLRVKDASGKLDHRLMGAAWAALTAPGGHRGNKYAGPNKDAAIAKLRRLYASENLPIPGEKKAKKSEAVQEQIAMPAEVVQQELPMGGATSFQEAQDYLTAQNELAKFYDTWYTFQVLASNILQSDEVADKSGEMQKLMRDCQKQLQTKSEVTLSKIEQLLESNFVTKSVTNEHPLDGVLEELKVSYTDTVSKNIPVMEKLQALQEPVNKLAQTIKDLVDVVNEPEKSQVQPQLSLADVESVVSKQLQPIVDAMTLLTQKQSYDASVVSSRQEIPQRRSILASTVPAVTQPIKKSETPNLRKLIEKSVGLQ